MRVCGPVSTKRRLRCHCSEHLDCHVDVLIRAWSEKNNVQNSEKEEICGLVTQKQFVFEIFCGHAGVASAVNDLGHVARAVDWHGNKFKPVFPVFNMDLTQRSQQQCLLRDLDVGCPTFVWMSPPCASALSAADESLAWKLERDDTLIQYCAQLWEWCRGKGIQVAIENPRASRLWASLCGCVFAQRRVFARLRSSNVCSELLGTSGPRLSQHPTSWRPRQNLRQVTCTLTLLVGGALPEVSTRRGWWLPSRTVLSDRSVYLWTRRWTRFTLCFVTIR